MKGSNSLSLCQLQMQLIVQQWIDSHNGPFSQSTVRQIVADKSSPSANHFIIELSEKEPPT